MQRRVAAMLAFAACVGGSVAFADPVDESIGAPLLVRTSPLGEGATATGEAPSAGSVFSNKDNFTGFGASSGGTAVASGVVLSTRILLDDCTATAIPGNLQGMVQTFSTANFNATPTTARMRLRFYLADGAGGAPGTALGGFSFAATSIPVGVSTWTFTPGTFNITAATFWAGLFFDNSGASATTAAQLDNLGQGNFNPVVVGSSLDKDFLSTANDPAGFLANNPTGAVRNSPFLGNPVANYGFEWVVPEPGSLALVGLGGAFALRRRRA